MKTHLPQLGKRVANIPQLKPVHRQPALNNETGLTLGEFSKARVQVEYEIGPGPWYWRGISASRPEYLCLLALQRMGWTPQFQVNFAGGRRLRGGQVIDILLSQAPGGGIVIDVIGYYHYGAAKAMNDALRQAEVELALPGVRYLRIDERFIDQTGWLDNFLEINVGRYGR